MNQSILTIKNLHASIEEKEILHGVDLSIKSAEVHAVMGPNGSGKSTLASVLMGHPGYEISNLKSQISNEKNRENVKSQIHTYSQVSIDHKDILELTAEQRAKAGLFLAFQSPIAIAGVTVMNLLRSAYESLHEQDTKTETPGKNPVLARRFTVGSMSIGEFMDLVKKYARQLHLDEALLSRGINDGFSGGERKKVEMLQALVLKPKFAIFDEIDTGLDVDALKVVAGGIELLKKEGVGILIITHYQRILKYIEPDFVHVLVKGNIVKSGQASLAKDIEENGYQQFIKA